MDTIVTPVTVITLDSTRIVHSIKADLVARYFPPVVRLVQYDMSLPVIAVSLMQNGQTYTLPSGAAANIRVHKPDATYVYNPALGCDSTRNIVYFEVTQAMAAANGDGLAIVEIVVDGDIAGTSLITLHFEENPVPEDAIESSDEWETIYELGERIIASTVTPVSTAAGMTDHNVVYLYTGTESGWNQGHMYYYNGTAWVDAGIAVTDKTLTVEGLAADAKKTGEEIADLKDGLKYNGIGENITKTPFIITANGKWAKSSDQYAGIWECQPGDLLAIEANASYGTVMAFLTDISNMQTGNIPQFATGYSNRISLVNNTYVFYKVPDDCKYLWIYLFDGTKSVVPNYLYFNGENFLNDLSYRINNKVKVTNQYLPADIFRIGCFLSTGAFDKNETRFMSVPYPIYTNVDLYIHTQEGVYVYVMILNDDLTIYKEWMALDHKSTIHIPKNKRFVIGFRDVSDIVEVVENMVITTSQDDYNLTSQNTNYFISSGKFLTYGEDLSKLIKVSSGDKIYIKTSKTIFLYLLGDDTLNYKETATILNEQPNVTIGQKEITIPNDCKYVLIDNASKGLCSAILNNIYDCYNHRYITTFDEGFIVRREDISAGDLREIPTSSSDYLATKVKLSSGGDSKRFSKRVLAVNHDDLTKSDYGYVRKIYNKYGYHANFSFILKPFGSLTEMHEFINGVREMLKDGNDIGLHAIMSSSFWWMNKLQDVRPNVLTTFAPSLGDIQNNYNSTRFTKKITASTKVNSIYIGAGTEKTFGEISSADFKALNATYTFFLGGETITGLDLVGQTQSWNKIRWLEYWYNALIDDSMGFSNNGNDILANFINTYNVPSGTAQTAEAYNQYYPDAAHLLSGKIVFFDDTTNPHYNDNSYQKVGRFSKGLYKGHASCCNYEIQEVCIEIAKAFLRYYVQHETLTAFDRHGVKYVDMCWLRDYINAFDDYAGVSVAGEHGRVYDTKLGIFETPQDILIRQGITCSTHFTPYVLMYEVSEGLYFGQAENKGQYFMSARAYGDVTNYLDLIGTEQGFKFGEVYTQTNMHNFFDGKGDPIKYAYENAGKQITSKTGNVAYVHQFFRLCIDAIRTSFASNKIPVLSLDTIKISANEMWAMELLCQYCQQHDIEIVPLRRAQELANSLELEYKKNYFINPAFNQKLLVDFGGASSSPYANIPDGWQVWSANYLTDSSGLTSEVNENAQTGERTWRVKNTGSLVTTTMKVFGLPAGRYRFSLKGIANVSGSHAAVEVYVKKNKDFIELRPFFATQNMSTPILSSNYTAQEYVEYSCEFTIPEKTYKTVDYSNPASAWTKGYGDNVSNVTIILYHHTDDDTTFKEPKLEMI